MIRACVFDLDGTLLDTVEDICAALARGLAVRGLPARTTEECKRLIGGGIREAVCRAAPGQSPAALDEIFRVYEETYSAHCTDRTVPYPGVGEALSALAENGAALGVLSNKPDADVKTIIARCFPRVPFRFAYGQVPDRPLKPDPAAAAPVLEVLGLPAEEIAYVGDSGTDMTFARAAGMLPVAAPWGYRSEGELIRCGAAFVLREAADLLALAAG